MIEGVNVWLCGLSHVLDPFVLELVLLLRELWMNVIHDFLCFCLSEKFCVFDFLLLKSFGR